MAQRFKNLQYPIFQAIEHITTLLTNQSHCFSELRDTLLGMIRPQSDLFDVEDKIVHLFW